jgi:putative transposase
MRQVEQFSGVRVVTWTILSNHFHVLLEVATAPADPLSDEEILERCRALYSTDGMVAVEWEFDEGRRMGGTILERVRAKYLKRMWDLSEFMKTLKQKFTNWFNRTHDRVGTLWESRFKSVLVEGSWACLLKVAAYIDLNAVRAGLVEDPKDYRWSGYAEAVAGERRARKGLALALADLKADANWRDVGPRYRKILFGIGEEKGAAAGGKCAGLSRKAVAKVFEEGGKLSLAQLLRCRVRYMTDGLAIGSASFIEAFFQSKREAFSAGRTAGARRMKGGDWEDLRTARDLSVEPVTPSCGDG